MPGFCTQCGKLCDDSELCNNVCIWCEPTLELIMPADAEEAIEKRGGKIQRAICEKCHVRKKKVDFGMPNTKPFWCCPKCGEE